MENRPIIARMHSFAPGLASRIVRTGPALHLTASRQTGGRPERDGGTTKHRPCRPRISFQHQPSQQISTEPTPKKRRCRRAAWMTALLTSKNSRLRQGAIRERTADLGYAAKAARWSDLSRNQTPNLTSTQCRSAAAHHEEKYRKMVFPRLATCAPFCGAWTATPGEKKAKPSSWCMPFLTATKLTSGDNGCLPPPTR